jgi:hypothetical protein
MKALIKGVGLLPVALVVILLGRWWNSTGTVDEAISLLNSHGAETQELISIVQADRSLGWINPGLSIYDYKVENEPITNSSQAHYKQIAHIMDTLGVRDLSILRDHPGDRRNVGALRYARFVIFEPGPFGLRKPVQGVWARSHADLVENDCKPARQPHWFACAFKA